MDHTFDVLVAKEYGINEAILIRNFQFWIIKNRANKKHFYEGRTWSYNSITAFTEIFPYLSVDQVRYAMDKLVDKGVLIKGNFNVKQYDRTLWYAFQDEEKWLAEFEQIVRNYANSPIRENSQMDSGKSPNAIGKIPEPIPDTNTDINKDSYIISKYLFDKIRERNPEHKEPNFNEWSKEADRMLRIDKRDKREVVEIIKWCQQDSFWQNNILSISKLRKQYDALKLKKQAESSGKNGKPHKRGEFNESKYTELLSEKEGAFRLE